MDSEATLKRYYKETDHIRLEPADASYPLILVRPDRLAESTLRKRYLTANPKRRLQIYREDELRIVGWFKGKA